MKCNLIVLFVVFGLMLSSCSKQQKPLEIEEVSLVGSAKLDVPERLSEWGLFDEPLAKLIPKKGVIPYELNSPLFTDYSLKKRFIKLPEYTSATYVANEVFDFPEGTILIKNFYYQKDLSMDESESQIIETRLLINEGKSWNAWTYVWNEDQSDADFEIAGRNVPVSWKNEEGVIKNVNYSVPNLVQCKSCHELSGTMTPIGPSARQLNGDLHYESGIKNQLIFWSENGMLDSLPSLPTVQKLARWDDPNSGTLDDRARAWLEINCAHCHRPEGPAKNTGLHLQASVTDNYRLGVNKPPIAAGRGSGGMKYSIVAGKPDESILLHRISSLDPGVMMPELGRKMIHDEGIELIRKWIAEMSDK